MSWWWWIAIIIVEAAVIFAISFVASYELVRSSCSVRTRMPNGWVALWRWVTRARSPDEPVA